MPTSRPTTLRAIGERIAPATELILPSLHLDVVAFGCTSASMALGEEAVFREIRRVRPEVACTTPVTAAFAAFKALGARRIGVLTPYAPEVNAVVRDYLNAHGAEVAAFATFDKRDDREAARISVDSIAAGIVALARGARLDAVFVSCTSLRLAESIAAIEAEAGIPVTSSDHAMAWHCLRLAGVDDTVAGAGRLFECGDSRASPSHRPSSVRPPYSGAARNRPRSAAAKTRWRRTSGSSTAPRRCRRTG